MDDIDLAEVGFVAVIAIVIGFIIYELLQALQNTNGPIGGAAKAIVAPVQSAEDTILGANNSAGVTGSNSNLFYSGIENFFTTGDLNGDTSSN